MDEEPESAPNQIEKTPDISVTYSETENEELIGTGGNAEVTKITISRSNISRNFAVKKPSLSGTIHENQVNNMLQEAEMWSKLDDHEHIVDIVDYGDQPIPWIMMEYMDGNHLGERSDSMDIPQSLWTALGVINGVRHAHGKGIAHLDLKPENILLKKVTDGWDIPKVADWGLSKYLLENTQSIKGISPQYAAPEQFNEKYGQTDSLTDIYQLGAVFYNLFTSQPPFDGSPTSVMRAVLDDKPTPPSEISNVPDGLDTILLTALSKEKKNRYEDIVYLRDDIEKLVEENVNDREKKYNPSNNSNIKTGSERNTGSDVGSVIRDNEEYTIELIAIKDGYDLNKYTGGGYGSFVDGGASNRIALFARIMNKGTKLDHSPDLYWSFISKNGHEYDVCRESQDALHVSGTNKLKRQGRLSHGKTCKNIMVSEQIPEGVSINKFEFDDFMKNIKITVSITEDEWADLENSQIEFDEYSV
jgi:tRNA A-37 threonylcarbamoyl transferase component Bud32